MTALTCPECGVAFTPTHHRQAFCSTTHKRAFHHVMMSRGQVSTPLLLTWRGTKEANELTRYAYRELCALASQWREEDRIAGRRPDVIAHSKMEMGWKACDL